MDNPGNYLGDINRHTRAIRDAFEKAISRRLSVQLQDLQLSEEDFNKIVQEIVNKMAAGKPVKSKVVGGKVQALEGIIKESFDEIMKSLKGTFEMVDQLADADATILQNELAKQRAKAEKLKAQGKMTPEESLAAKNKAQADRDAKLAQAEAERERKRAEAEQRRADKRAKDEADRQARKAQANADRQAKAQNFNTNVGIYAEVLAPHGMPDMDVPESIKNWTRRSARASIEKAGTNLISNGIDPKVVEAAIREAMRVIDETLVKQIKARQKEIADAEKKAEKDKPLGASGDPDKIKRDTARAKREAEQAAREAQKLREQAAQATQDKFLQDIFVNNPDVMQALGASGLKNLDKAINVARQHGFSSEDLSGRLQYDIASQTTRMKFKKPITTEGIDPNTGQPMQVPTGFFKEGTLVVDRFGQALFATNKRLLDFFSAIKENVKEVFRWSLGVGLVYGTMYKLQEIVSIAIDNQTKLADITVALGNAQRDVNDVFTDAASVAKQTGESINAVLEAYTLAYRASGSVTDETQRTVVANKLLSDSMILTKLSGLSSAEAIDVLSGSLRQLQTSTEKSEDALMRGTELIDKWVAVTQAANVDTATLATAFSITSESAENAGVSVEELNAVIASLSEKIGGLGGKETGNAVRALIGGMYSDQAKQSLAEFGITVLDSTGKMKDFLDVTGQIYTLWKEGVISDDQLNKIGYALGGGVRRGQQYVAFLSDYNRIQEIVAAQAGATGSAEQALAKKLDTVQTATTQLGNAFQTLAQTVGQDGGVLSMMTELLNISTGLVDMLTSVSKILGNFTVPVAALTAIQLLGGAGKFSSYMNAGIGLGITSGLSGLGNTFGLGTNLYTMGMASKFAGVPSMLGMGATGLVAGGLGMAPTLLNRAGKGEGEMWPALAGGAGGAALGAAMAAAFAPPLMPIMTMAGSLLGSTAADTLYNDIMGYKPEFENFFQVGNITPPGGDVTKTDAQKSMEEWIKSTEEYSNYVMSQAGGGKFGATLASSGGNALKEFFGMFTDVSGVSEYTPESMALKNIRENKPELYQQLMLEYFGLQNKKPIVAGETPTTQTGMFMQAMGMGKNPLYGQISSQFSGTLQDYLLTNRITSKQYNTGMERLPQFGALLPQYQVALGDQSKLSPDALAKFTTFATQEELDTINQLKDNIMLAADAISKDTGFEYMGKEFKGADLETQKNLMQKQMELYINQVNMNTAKGLYKTPGIQDTGGLSAEGIDYAYAEAMKLQKKRDADLMTEGILDQSILDELTKVEDQFGKDMYSLGVDGGVYFKEGLRDENKDLFDQVLKDQKEKMKQFKTLAPTEMGLSFFGDTTQAQLSQALQGYAPLVAQLQAASGKDKSGNFLWNPEETDILPVLKDGIGKPLHLDMRILQYLLQQILDTEKKQLEGIYNLPTDSSFYVPWWEGFKRGGSGGGGGPIVGGTGTTGTSTVTSSPIIVNPNSMAPPPPDSSQWGRPYPNTAKPTTVAEWLGLPLYGPPSPDTTKSAGTSRDTGGAPKTMSTKLNMNFTSNIRLVVDGRQMAMVVKKYLAEDLVTYNNNSSSLSGVI